MYAVSGWSQALVQTFVSMSSGGGGVTRITRGSCYAIGNVLQERLRGWFPTFVLDSVRRHNKTALNLTFSRDEKNVFLQGSVCEALIPTLILTLYDAIRIFRVPDSRLQ
jgi:hypothetical protein